MGKSSSSSSSSSSSDDEYKHMSKEQKKQRKKYKKMMKKQGKYYKGMPYPPAGGYPGQAYPGVSRYPSQPGGMPPYPPQGQPGAYPTQGAYPPAQSGYPPAGYPPAGQPQYPGAAGGQPGYPAQAPYPGQPSYPGQPPASGQAPYPGQPGQPPYPGQPGYPPAPGGPSGYPPAPGQDLYPSAPAPGAYPPSVGDPNPAYPPTAPVYPPPAQGGAYPPAGGPPPPVGAGYPPAGAGYPPTSGTGLAASSGYPQAPLPAAGAPGYAPHAPGVSDVTHGMAQVNIQGGGGGEVYFGTVQPAKPFNPEKDAEILRKAMKGLGTDEKAIINIISQRSNKQRQEIKTMFKTMYGKDLIKDLQSELSGHVEELVMALFMDPSYYDAWTLHKAMSGPGTKDSVLIEVLCTRTNQEIKNIVKNYKIFFKRDLESDIGHDTSGHFKRLLISCCQGNRNELTEQQMQMVRTQGYRAIVDVNQAKEDAQALYRAGEGRLGTDESKFLSIMALRNHYQLRATFEEYTVISGRDIHKAIGKEMSGDLEDAFKALIQSARNRPEYFADRLYSSMKGMGTNDSKLIRIVASRSEIDLGNIKQVFQQKRGKSLRHMIEKDTSGDYKKLLVAIVGN